MDDAMTSDRSAKKAARAWMAATGEPYSTAQRAVQTGPDRPAPLARPPAIDPREHAVHSRHWGVLACYLVRYEGRYSAESGWPASMTPPTTGARARSANSGIWTKPSKSSPPSPSGPPAASAAGRPPTRRTFTPVSSATGRQ
jgi:hypothetical protein